MTASRMIVTLLSLLVLPMIAVAAPPPAATQSDAPELTTRQKDLLLQLSDAEANIQAINKALARTGYKVGVAYDRIESSLKGNELMNRKGGGPVRWDEFYGKTAKDYGSSGWGDKRPKQFDYIYRANNDQINRAGQQIASLEKDQAGLLARRRKHEDDQSRLWAILAFEQIREHEIDLHPICRFALKPAGADANMLRPLILFLRTADRLAADGLDTLQSDQPGTFKATGQRMQSAYTELQKSLADALDAGDLDSSHRKAGQALKAACKELSEQCIVIADSYANALDRDQAKQDNSKLEFRAQLQTSLSMFAVAVGKLDDDVTKTAREWKVEGAKGMPTPDVVAATRIAAKEEPRETGGADIVLKSSNRVVVRELKEGEPRLYDSKPLRTIDGVANDLHGYHFTSIPQRLDMSYEVRVKKAGTLYVFGFRTGGHVQREEIFGGDATKWEPADGTISGKNIAGVFRRNVSTGEVIKFTGFESQVAAESIEISSEK